jgi:UDPglucose--hexose-1-phosphate uridylyltransferase
MGIYDMMTGFGAHEVIIETPDHYKKLKDQSINEITDVIRVSQSRIRDLHNDNRIRYILLFKNQGLQAGASLAHSHLQLIATPITPKRVREELRGAENYYKIKERCIYCDIINDESVCQSRVVYENSAYLSFCPYASRFPFEVWILPKQHGIDFFSEAVEQTASLLAEQLKVIMQKLAIVLDNPQYNYVVHTAPNRFPRRGYWQTIEEDFHWHLEIMPKLTRIAGFEWGSGFYINPVSPEEAARSLREIKVEV